MKTLILLSAIVVSTTAMATQDKCYDAAKTAAFKYAVSEEMLTTMDEFDNRFGNEVVDVYPKKGWQQELWSFGDGSAFIYVTADLVKKKCFIKDVTWGQDDGDIDE